MSNESKKMTLQEAMQQKLAAKKHGNTKGNNSKNFSTATKGMTSQVTKKPNNQRKRMGV